MYCITVMLEISDLFVNEGDIFDILLKDYKSTCFLSLKRLFSPPAIIKKDYGNKYVLFFLLIHTCSCYVNHWKLYTPIQEKDISLNLHQPVRTVKHNGILWY